MDSVVLGALTNSTPTIYDEVQRDLNEQRVLMINEAIDDCVIDNYITFILQWNIEDKDLPAGKRKPIRMFINSPGGTVSSADALIGAMLSSKTPIYTIGMGQVASAAYLIYLAGEKRYSLPHTSYLQHEGEMSIANSTTKAKDTMEFMTTSDEEVKDFIVSRTNIDPDIYDKNFEREWWMTTTMAQELGVVQKVIGKDASIDEVL